MRYLGLLTFIITITWSSCMKEDFFREKDTKGDLLWQATPILERGDESIKVTISNPGIVTDYYADVRDPDYLEVLYSTDPNNLEESTTAEYYEPAVYLSGLENDVPYYVKVISHAEGYESVASATYMTVPGSTAAIVNIDFSFDERLNRFIWSPDQEKFVFQNHDDRIYIRNRITATVQVIDVNAYLGSWNQSSDQFIFSSNAVVDNILVDKYFIIYDLETEQLDTVLELDQSRWSFYTPFFGRSNDEIIYQTGATTESDQYSELWSYDLQTQEIVELFSFEDEKFQTFIRPQVIRDNHLIMVGAYEDQQSGIYSLDLNAGVLEPIIIDGFSISDPQISPDGTRVLFASYRSGHHDLWAYQIDDQRYEQLTDVSIGSLFMRSFQWHTDDEIYVMQYNSSRVSPEMKIVQLE